MLLGVGRRETYVSPAAHLGLPPAQRADLILSPRDALGSLTEKWQEKGQYLMAGTAPGLCGSLN